MLMTAQHNDSKSLEVLIKSKQMIPTVTKSSWITLNVGGQSFLTTKRTLMSTPSIFTPIIQDSEGDSSRSIIRPDYWKKLYRKWWSHTDLTTRKVMLGAGGVVVQPREKSHVNFSVYFQIRRKSDDMFYIDRDPAYFAVVLNFMRHGKLHLDQGLSLRGVMEEANYFEVKELVELLAQMGVNRIDPIAHAYRDLDNI